MFIVLATGTIRTLRPWVDEAWYGTPAWMLAEKGYMGTPSFDTEGSGMQRIDRYSYWIMPLYPLAQAAWYKIVPFSLLAMRTLSLIFVLGGISCFTLFVRRLIRDDTTALLFFALMCCDYIANTATGMGRPDALAFLFNAASFASYVYLREKHFAWALLAGNAFAVASGLTHPNGGILTVLGLALLVVYFDRARLRWSHLGVVAIPYVAGALGWGAYILEDPGAFLSQYGFQSSGRFSGLLHPFDAISREIHIRYLNNMGLGGHSEGSVGPHFLKAAIFLAYFASIAATLTIRDLRRTTAVRVLLGMAGCYLFYYTFLEGTKAAYYLIYLICVYTALFAIWVRWLWARQAIPRWAMAGAVACLMLIGAGGCVQRMRLNKYRNFDNAVAYLKAHMKPGDLVDGSHELGFGIGFTDQFVDDSHFGTGNVRPPDYIVMEEIYRGRIDTFHEHDLAVYNRIRERLKQYHVVYSQGNYDILARNVS